MTDKKATKTDKQAEKKQPTELKDEQLDDVQGGVAQVGLGNTPKKGPGPSGLVPIGADGYR